MTKDKFLQIICASFEVTEVTQEKASRLLGIASSTVRRWPEVITPAIARGVVGDYVRLRKRIPVEIVNFVRSVK